MSDEDRNPVEEMFGITEEQEKIAQKVALAANKMTEVHGPDAARDFVQLFSSMAGMSYTDFLIVMAGALVEHAINFSTLKAEIDGKPKLWVPDG